MVSPDNRMTVIIGKDVSTAGADTELNITLPPGCDGKKAPFCFELKRGIDNDDHTFDIGLDIGRDEGKIGAYVGITTKLWPDPSLKKAHEFVLGSVTPIGIKSDVATAGVTLSMKREFEYDLLKDTGPGTKKRFLDFGVSLDVRVADISFSSIHIDDNFTMTTQSANDKLYFIGYAGALTTSMDLLMASDGASITAEYSTPSWQDSNKKDGWATKVFLEINWSVDFLWWKHKDKYYHVFYCEPSDNTLCRSVSSPGPSVHYPIDTLYPGDCLGYNSNIVSQNGFYLVAMQGDGNRVLYDQAA